MTVVEILQELPKLTEQERAVVRDRLVELDGGEWMDDAELTDEEKRLLDERLEECRRHPDALIPWEEAKGRILAQLKA